MNRYAPKVALLNSYGNHLRYVPATLAEAMVCNGAAAPVDSAGRVREVSLICTADTHAQRIGEPTMQASSVKFYRWTNLDCGARIVEHHPRCFYREEV